MSAGAIYLTVAYLVTFGGLAGYLWWVLARRRAITDRQREARTVGGPRASG